MWQMECNLVLYGREVGRERSSNLCKLHCRRSEDLFSKFKVISLRTTEQCGDRGGTVVKVCATNRKVAGSIPGGVIGIFL